MAESNQLAKLQDELTVPQLVAQVDKIQQAMREVMREGEHYGTIPGTEKPTLYKPGAEKLCTLFRLGPTYPTDLQRLLWEDSGHLTVMAHCVLRHIPSTTEVAHGLGMCSTKESRYAYRNARPICPECGQEAIFKSKKEGEGFYCWKKQGGCGVKFSADEQRIVNQPTGKVPNKYLADTYNTVLKMAAKRSLVAAVLNGTAASDSFTQDLEDATQAAVPDAVTKLVEGYSEEAVVLEAQQMAEARGAKRKIEMVDDLAGIPQDFLEELTRRLASWESQR